MDAASFRNENTVLRHQHDETMEQFHQSFDQAVETVSDELGETHPLWINGDPIHVEGSFTVRNPGNLSEAIGTFPAAREEEVDLAVRAAVDAFRKWRQTDWRDRVKFVRRAADIAVERKYTLSATLTLENGKNRFEAMADIDEGIDFLRFYAQEIERNAGYLVDTGEPTPGQHCNNRLVPFGVFGVIGPFNFPFAILLGMTTGAVITGNTAVIKPASQTPLIAHKAYELFAEAGMPDGVVNLVTGGGKEVGGPLVEHEEVDGVVFTGSRAVGRSIEATFLEQEKHGPVIAELGGKNPVIVTANADLNGAVSGVKNGAFGFSGQKCSATARVYVHEDLFDRFVSQLVEETEDLVIERPQAKDAFISPIIDTNALDRYREICTTAHKDGEIRTGGEIITSSHIPDGRYVTPTVVTDISHDHELAREEHFLPFVTIHPISDLTEGIEKSNDSEYGLCAGLFSEDDAEIATWFEHIEAGMCYVNRKQSATTGALVQAQPFGGWKSSGVTSKFAGGYWYLPQFMREQTRTIVDES